jgi:hypothetical protein
MHNYTLLLDTITGALTAKGYLDPDAVLQFRPSDGYMHIRLEFDYKVRESSGRKYVTVRDYDLSPGKDVEEVQSYIDRALELIEELPTVREAAIKEFVNSLERLKDEAGELGIDADFVNPLASIMEKLASNALPAPKQ